MTPQSWYEDELFFVLLLYEEEEEEGELMDVICFLWRPGEAEAVRGCCFTGDWNMSEVSPCRDLEIEEIFTEPQQKCLTKTNLALDTELADHVLLLLTLGLFLLAYASAAWR